MTLSFLARAKASGYSTLVVTVDTMALGWRPLDLDVGFHPFGHGLGIQIALSDPVFMRGLGREPLPDTDVDPFPYDPRAVEAAIAAGDKGAVGRLECAGAWGRDTVNGTFRTWEDLRFVRKNWEGPVVLKGIMTPEVRRSAGFVEVPCADSEA